MSVTASEQLKVLNASATHKPFARALHESGLYPLRAASVDVLQVNVGKLCNQTCKHCHVDAGPHRREQMTRETAELCIEALRRGGMGTLDITGGAPELNPNFPFLVEQGRKLGRHVMDRCNLTVLLLPSQADLGAFLAEYEVEVVASLPYFLPQQTDVQRGDGVFEKSIAALRLLNGFGYGRPGSPRRLHLVFNPVGAFLPPPQRAIEADFKRELGKRYGVEFHSLYTMTNMPISRFLEFLERSGNYDRYMQKLIGAYNPSTARGVMCRNLVSVGWDGTVYDCDFNQMLEMGVTAEAGRHIATVDWETMRSREIAVGQHCYGCTAGTGSSCGGAISG